MAMARPTKGNGDPIIYECTICMEPLSQPAPTDVALKGLTTDPTTLVATRCGHAYHQLCLQHWLSTPGERSCPSCRAVVEQGELLIVYPSACSHVPQENTKNSRAPRLVTSLRKMWNNLRGKTKAKKDKSSMHSPQHSDSNHEDNKKVGEVDGFERGAGFESTDQPNCSTTEIGRDRDHESREPDRHGDIPSIRVDWIFQLYSKTLKRYEDEMRNFVNDWWYADKSRYHDAMKTYLAILREKLTQINKENSEGNSYTPSGREEWILQIYNEALRQYTNEMRRVVNDWWYADKSRYHDAMLQYFDVLRQELRRTSNTKKRRQVDVIGSGAGKDPDHATEPGRSGYIPSGKVDLGLQAYYEALKSYLDEMRRYVNDYWYADKSRYHDEKIKYFQTLRQELRQN